MARRGIRGEARSTPSKWTRTAARYCDLKNPGFARQCGDFAAEVRAALAQYGKARHPRRGEIYAFEVDAYGSALLMDDAGMPGLLAMPYLGSVAATDPVYRNT